MTRKCGRSFSLNSHGEVHRQLFFWGVLTIVSSTVRVARGHGYLQTPRSLNFVAFEDGLDPGVPGATPETPLKQWCSHCVNRGGGCGTVGQQNYNYPPGVLGNVLPFQSQATYLQGSVIEVDSILTTYHKGYFQLKACRIDADGEVPTQECFDRSPLTFVSDELYGMGPDPDYDTRAYLYHPGGIPGVETQWGGNPAGMTFKHRFRLPADLTGNMVVLQWHYVTANTCHDEGYTDYNFPWTLSNLADCEIPLPSDGEVGGPFKPEQFFNCAQVQVLPQGSSPPPPDDGGTDPPPPSRGTNTNYCGTSWLNADATCAVACPRGVDNECPQGQNCFADVTSCVWEVPPEERNSNFCGTSFEDASSKCLVSCPTGLDMECPLGSRCFADVTSCANGDLPDTGGNLNFCGETWEDADSSCAVRCPRGVDEECPIGKKCFADATSCANTPNQPAPAPAPNPPPVLPEPDFPTPSTPITPPAAPPVGSCNSAEAMSVNVGYYQSWAIWRNGCNPIYPEDIDVAGMGYTHLVYSFASISAGYELEPWNGVEAEEFPLYQRFNALKLLHPNLKTFIAVGGWTHNDPGAFCNRFTDTAGTEANRRKFAASAVEFMRTHNFDGIDFDWEYPANPNRCGKAADKENYALLVQAIREAIEDAPDPYLITMAVPASIPGLELGYNLVSLSESLDWFNIMTYDIYGTWSDEVGSHTDMRHIESVIPHFFANGVAGTSLVIGLGAYGRTFSLSDPNCDDIGCPFNGGRGGGCPVWDQIGYTAYFTIEEILASGSFKKNEYNELTQSMELVTNDNEFISYDNPMSFGVKVSYAASNCFRGYMWWAVDMILESFQIEYQREPTVSPGPTTATPTSLPTISMMPTTLAPTFAPFSGPNCLPGETGWKALQQCRQYYHCQNGVVSGAPLSCPEGTLYDEARKYCNWEDQVTCAGGGGGDDSSPVPEPPTTVECRVSTGWQVDPSSECKQFYYCSGGMIVGDRVPCPEGTQYDEDLQFCNWEDQVQCGSETLPDPAPPSGGPNCPAGHEGWLPYDACRSYFYCQAGTLVGAATPCPVGTLYDTSLNLCNWEDQVICDVEEDGVNDCIDSAKKVSVYLKKKKETQDCTWLAMQEESVITWYCENVKNVAKKRCKLTCGTCRKKKCKDGSKGFPFFKAKKQNCSWIGTSAKRIKTHCLPGSEALGGCGASCNACASNN